MARGSNESKDGQIKEEEKERERDRERERSGTGGGGKWVGIPGMSRGKATNVVIYLVDGVLGSWLARAPSGGGRADDDVQFVRHRRASFRSPLFSPSSPRSRHRPPL